MRSALMDTHRRTCVGFALNGCGRRHHCIAVTCWQALIWLMPRSSKNGWWWRRNVCSVCALDGKSAGIRLRTPERSDQSA